MNNHRLGLLVALVGLTSVGAAGCGGDDGFECGDGTVEVDGKCLPTSSACATGTVYDAATRTCTPDGTGTELVCGAGTVESMGMCVTDLNCGTGTSQVGNECLPDGSVLCTGNTMFDPATGTCVIDPDGICADGTVYIVATGECVPFDETLTADFTETTEPNDPAFSDTAMISPFDLPAAGASVTLGGCIEPRDFNDDGATDADLDFFTFEVTEPTVLQIQADGVGGLSAGAIVISLEDRLANYIRGVVDNTNDGASKTVFLPAPGVYAIAVSDSRTLVPLLLGETALPAGGPEACYFVQVAPGTLPASSATLESDTPRVGTFTDAPQVFEFTADEESLVFVEINELDNEDMPVNFIAIDGDARAVNGNEYLGQAFIPFELAAGETGTLVVESVFDLSPDPIDFQITVSTRQQQDFPDTGDVTLTNRTGSTPNANSFGFTDFDFIDFDATAGDVVHLTTDGGGTTALLLAGEDGSLLAPCGVSPFFGNFQTCDTDVYLYINVTGRYRLGFYDAGTPEGETFTVNVTREHITPGTLTVGMDGSIDLSDGEFEFFVFDAGGSEWLEYAVTGLMNVTNVDVDFFSLTEPGFSNIGGGGVPRVDSETTADAFQRIYLGMGERFLVRITDADGVDGDETLTFTINDVVFTDLGTVSEAAPVMRAGDMLTADEAGLYIVRAEEGSNVRVQVTPEATVDASISLLDGFDVSVITVINEGGVGVVESFSGVADDSGVFVFSVHDESATGGAIDVSVTSTDPVTYDAVASAITFSDICPSGGGMGTAVTMFSDDDDGWSERIALPFPFIYYGAEQTNLFIGTNGRIAFRDDIAGVSPFATIGSSTGNNIVFPFADDLVATEACYYHDMAANAFVVQLTGNPYSSAGTDTRIAQYQVIFRPGSRSIDVVLSPAHTVPSAGAEIGVQGPAASLVTRYTDPLMAGGSVTFTPQ